MPGNGRDLTDEKAERRAARELIATYHQTQLRALLDRVRAGFAQFDAGDIDEFDFDGLIHHYKRSVAELWKFSAQLEASGSRPPGRSVTSASEVRSPTGGTWAPPGATDRPDLALLGAWA